MSVAGTAGDRTLSGVKAGVLGKGSSEAVNGAQLFATNANVEANAGNISKNGEKIATNAADIATNKATIAVNAAGIKNVGDNVSGMASSLGGGASVDANGKFVAPTYSVQGKQANTVGEALAALNGGVDVNKDNITQNTASISKNAADITTNKTSIANITKDINSGNVGLVKQDAESLALTVAAGTGGSTMSVAGTAGDRTLSGVKAGVLGKGSSEAVNGAQLFATNANVEANAGNISKNGEKIATNAADIATNKATIAVNAAGIKNVGDNVSGMASSLGGGASVDANGKFVAPTYSVQGKQANTVGEALAALNGGVDVNKDNITQNTASISKNAADITTNKTSIANITKDINSGNVGLVKQDAESLALTVAAGTGGSTMSVAGTAGDRTLSGVKAGVLGKGSSEAVNGAQLFATNANVEANAGNISKNGEKIATNAADIATNKATIAVNAAGIKNVGDNVSGMALSLGGGASVDANGKFVAPTYSVQGKQANTVGEALAALNGGVDVNKDNITQNTASISKNAADITTNKTSIANITKDINSGNVGLVKQDAESLALTVAAGTGGSTMSVAGTAGDRTLSGVKAGVLGKGSSEAVNGAQLFATNANVEANAGNISKNGEKIATNAADIATNKATIAVNAAGIKNVGDNVSGMASSLGGGASVDANGKFVAPTYSVQGKQANTVGEALAALNGGVDVNKDNITQNTASISKNAADITTNKTSIANITKDINSGNVGLVKQDAESLALTVAAGTGGSTMSVAGTAGDRTLSGVKAGVLGKGSSEAVNGAQLFATNANVEANAGNISKNGEKIATNAADIATNKATIAVNAAGIKNVGDNVSGMALSLGGGASVDANGKFVAPTYSGQGKQANTVGEALAALNGGVDVNKDNITQNTASISKNAADITTNKTSIANITKDINSGNVGLVKQDAESLALTVAAGTGGSTMSVAGTAGDRTLSGVKAGVLGKGSSEAVNGAQLFATNANVETNAGNISENGKKIATNAADIATNKATIAVNAAGIKNVGDNVSGMALSLGGGASVDANGKFVAPTYSVQGKQANTVGEALAALNGGVDVNKDNITQNTASISKNAADITTNKTSIANITKDINSGNVGLVKQDAESLALTVAAGTGGSTMSVAGTAGDRTLSGVKAGVLGKGSSEAVNGAQLFATNANVETNAGNISENGKKIATNAADIATNKATIALNTSDIVSNKTNIAANTAGIKNVGDNVSGMASSLGGGASVDANGKFVAPSYSVQGLKVNSVGGALTALNDGVDTNKTSIANITKDINSGNVGLVKQDANTLALSVAASTGGTSMSLAGTDGNRKLTGVKAGMLNANSSEAVNGSQLFATNAAVDINTTDIASNAADIKKTSGNLSNVVASLGGGASIDANGNVVAPSYSVQGQKVNSVGGALTALNDGVDTNKTSIANITKDINSGNVGLVKQDANTLALTVAASTGGTSMSLAGINGSRVLSGVKAGRTNDDAVNVSQLKNLFDELGASDALIDETNGKIKGPRYNIQGTSYNLSDSLAALDARMGAINTNMTNVIRYDDDARNKVTLGGGAKGGPVTMTNVAKGTVAAGSTDAVNGGQLHEVKQQVDKNTSDISDIKNNVEGIDNGTVGLVQQDPATQQITVGKDKGGNSVSLTGTEGDRVLTGVANGIADNDAATVGQVKDIAKVSSNVSTNNSSNRVKAVASGKDSAALGGGAKASAENSVALGSNAHASGKNTIALGNGSVADRDNSLSVGAMGAERQITNVARGTAATDAVNVEQLNEGLSSLTNTTNQNFRELGQRMKDMKDKLSGGVASAMAMGSLPQPYSAGAGMMSMGGGTYNGQSAMAIGASKVSENGKWVTKVQGSTNTQGDYGVSVGVGYQW